MMAHSHAWCRVLERRGLVKVMFGAVLAAALIWSVGCSAMPEESADTTSMDEASTETERTFDDDVELLREQTSVVVLGSGPDSARLVVVPAWQGRVMTSTAGGAAGVSFGWINYDLVASGEVQPHINALGGEDRFWMGPEGGQFSIFFAPGDPFDLEHWQTPPVIDTDPYSVVSLGGSEVVLQREATLTNYSGTEFQVRIDRTVRLLTVPEIATALDVFVSVDLDAVAFESVNTITNIGDTAWTKEAGLLSVWILGMFKHSPETTVAIPFQPGPESERGPVVNDEYFGKVPSDRLKVGEGVLYFKGDGQYRSKIGLSPRRARPVAGSYDGQRGVLTLVQYTQPEGAMDYVNSMWEIQDEPYAGDVVNSYNDGPAEPGATSLGPFYELETSSPAAMLGPGEALTHEHRTIHLVGSPEMLDGIARSVLGVGIGEIADALE